MCVYIRNKFQVSSIILTTFRYGWGLISTPPLTHAPQNVTTPPPPPLPKKKPTQITVKQDGQRLHKFTIILD